MPISADEYRRALALPDLTDAAHGPHALQLLVQDTAAALRSAWSCDVVVHRAHPVVSIADNYELLGYPPGAAARDARYTRYVGESEVLRTHTSAMTPACCARSRGRPTTTCCSPAPGSSTAATASTGSRSASRTSSTFALRSRRDGGVAGWVCTQHPPPTIRMGKSLRSLMRSRRRSATPILLQTPHFLDPERGRRCLSKSRPRYEPATAPPSSLKRR